MADNVTIPASGTGDATPVVATDQLAGGSHVQFMKVMDGTLDSSNKWLINADGSASFVASGTTDSGNPVKVGGKYTTTPPTFTTGQRGDLQLDSRGNLHTSIFNPDTGNAQLVGNPSIDGLASGQASYGIAFNVAYNGTGWDRVRSAAKGVQGANALAVHDMKDTGRVNIMWTISGSQPGATSETLQTVTESRDGAATTTFTSQTVTSGKRLRLTSVMFAIEGAGGTPAVSRGRLRIRFNTAGAVTTSSPLQFVLPLSGAATAKSVTSVFDDLPDGVEFLGDGTKQIGITIESPDWVTTTNIPVFYASIFGFEY
jgi:hypothetical protein